MRPPTGLCPWGVLLNTSAMYHYQRVRLEEARRIAREFRDLTEDLPTNTIDKSEFPNPLPAAAAEKFMVKGFRDGNSSDDKVVSEMASFPAGSLKPSQTAVYLGKSLGMAINGVKGGNLGSIVSSDNYILDGHHRWAATMFNDPSATVEGIRVSLKIGDLVPVLRAAGDALGNERRGEPSGGDKNIFEATAKDALDCILLGKFMDHRYWTAEKGQAWLASIGGESMLKQRMSRLSGTKPPSGAPPRDQMPVIDADKGQHTQVANALKAGQLDVRKPYASK
jgi:hypothetical protein